MTSERVELLRALIAEAIETGVVEERCATHDGVFDEMFDENDDLDRCVFVIRWVTPL